jgi:hypothetical protein
MADSLAVSFGRPFAEQAAFFRQKLNLPTERWDDIMRAAHDRAFIVAGVAKADLLADLRAAVQRAIDTGGTIQQFRADFDGIVAKHGWTGWTGEGTPGGYAWRTRVIYQTNMSTSYAAGRWAQLNDPGLAAIRPYWRYNHAEGVRHPRPQHVAWHGLVLPRGHPFWPTHYPPNDWLCHCYVTAASARDYAAAQAAGRATPPAGWDAIDPKTGAPVGIGRGWDYAPGASTDTSLRDMVADKLITYPPAITKALSRDLNRYIAAHLAPADFAAAVLADRAITYDAWLGFPDNFDAIEAATGLDVRNYPGILPADVPRHVERGHEQDGAGQRPVRVEDYNLVWEVLTAADSIEASHPTGRGLPSILAWKEIAGERYRAVFEVRPGKKNRTLALVSLIVKTR